MVKPNQNVQDPNQFMCMNMADAMSCATMTSMAKDEVARDFKIRTLVASSPACAFMQEYKDLDQELLMFAGSGISKNQCFDPCTLKKNGSWEEQFDQSIALYPGVDGIMSETRTVPACFDARTRPR